MNEESPTQKLRIADPGLHIEMGGDHPVSLATKIVAVAIVAPPIVLVLSLIAWGIVAIWRAVL